MITPKISVVIPTYNRAEKVGKTIESVLTQTFRDLEIIVVDDGSSDNTCGVLRQTFGDRIRYFAQPNSGVSVARNKGAELARGEWIAFLDSDDLWESDKLEWQLKALETFGSGCGACYTDTKLYNHQESRSLFEMAKETYRHEGELGVNSEILRLLVRPGGAGMVVCVSSFMARADILRSVSGFNPRLSYSADSELMFRIGMRTRFCYVNRALVWFDRSPAGIRHVGLSANWDKMEFFLEDSQLRLEGLMRFDGTLSKPVRKIVREQLRDIHSGWTNWYLQQGKHDKARQAALRAVQVDPTLNVTIKLLLSWISPQLALRSVQRHQEVRRTSAGIV